MLKQEAKTKQNCGLLNKAQSDVDSTKRNHPVAQQTAITQLLTKRNLLQQSEIAGILKEENR